jgi:hypothetical protein
MVRGSILRFLVMVQAVLLVPPLLLGSVCLKEGEATLEPVTCSCSIPVSWASSQAPGTHVEQDCGPCRDVTLSALGSRTQDPVSMDGLLLHPSSLRPLVNVSRPDPIAPEPSGSPSERSFSVLRC